MAAHMSICIGRVQVPPTVSPSSSESSSVSLPDSNDGEVDTNPLKLLMELLKNRGSATSKSEREITEIIDSILEAPGIPQEEKDKLIDELLNPHSEPTSNQTQPPHSDPTRYSNIPNVPNVPNRRPIPPQANSPSYSNILNVPIVPIAPNVPYVQYHTPIAPQANPLSYSDIPNIPIVTNVPNQRPPPPQANLPSYSNIPNVAPMSASKYDSPFSNAAPVPNVSPFSEVAPVSKVPPSSDATSTNESPFSDATSTDKSPFSDDTPVSNIASSSHAKSKAEPSSAGLNRDKSPRNVDLTSQSQLDEGLREQLRRYPLPTPFSSFTSWSELMHPTPIVHERTDFRCTNLLTSKSMIHSKRHSLFQRKMENPRSNQIQQPNAKELIAEISQDCDLALNPADFDIEPLYAPLAPPEDKMLPQTTQMGLLGTKTQHAKESTKKCERCGVELISSFIALHTVHCYESDNDARGEKTMDALRKQFKKL